MRIQWVWCVLLAVACLGGIGCGHHRSSPTAPRIPSEAEELAQIQALLNRSGLISDSLYTYGMAHIAAGSDSSVVAFQHLPHLFEIVPPFTFSEPDPSGRPRRAVGMICKYVKADFDLLLSDNVTSVRKPRGNDDWFRNFVFRRANDSQAPWVLDSVSAVLMLSDDKLSCDACHTQIQSVRLRLPGLLDTLITQADASRAIPVANVLGFPANAAVELEVMTLLPGDEVFLNHKGQWSQLVHSGSLHSGQFVTAPGIHDVAFQALTDSSLTAAGRHYSQYTFLLRYSAVTSGRAGLRQEPIGQPLAGSDSRPPR